MSIIPDYNAIAQDSGGPSTSVVSARSKLASAIAQIGSALEGLSEVLVLDQQLRDLIYKGQTFDAQTYSTLDHLDETIEHLSDALRLTIEAVGVIPPHQLMYVAIQRYQNGDD